MPLQTRMCRREYEHRHRKQQIQHSSRRYTGQAGTARHQADVVHVCRRVDHIRRGVSQRMSWLEVAAACHKDRVRRMRNKPNPEMLRSQELEKAKSRSHQSEATRALLRAVTYFEQVYEQRQAGALFLSSRGFADNHGHHNPAAANLIDYLADWVLCIRRTATIALTHPLL